MSNLNALDISSLLARLEVAERLEREAIRELDMRRQNRLADERVRIVSELKSRGSEGRIALEGLLNEPSPDLRLTGAIAVYPWAPNRAVQVIEDLLRWSQNPDVRRSAHREDVVTIAITTKMFLADHYGISIIDVVPKVTGVRRPQNRDVG